MARGKQMRVLAEMLAEKKRQRERLDIEIATLENALRRASGASEVPRQRAARSNVKKLVLELLAEVGPEGLNASKVVELAASRGRTVERGTVSSLLSRLKNDGVVTYDGRVYRLDQSQYTQVKPEEVDKCPTPSVVNLRASRG